MPELPEVETVRTGLEKILETGTTCVEHISFPGKPLRGGLPRRDAQSVKGKRILKLSRRAKYLIFELEDWVLLSHLGMTGSWRVKAESRDHDHVEIALNDGRALVYRDPRRFGQFDVLSYPQYFKDPRLITLGPEPLSLAFSDSYLLGQCKGRNIAIKKLIMDQKRVVGVGNIYASEALFLAGISPLKLASDITREECKRLVWAIQEVLSDAISLGGTTLLDFRQAGGSQGYFQNQLLVYGSSGDPCPKCDTPISSRVLGGRSTYWCPLCQPMV